MKGTGSRSCGKTHRQRWEVSGHDFSRAVIAPISSRALAPEGSGHVIALNKLLSDHIRRRRPLPLLALRNSAMRQHALPGIQPLG